MKAIRPIIVLFAAVALWAGCGGGGGQDRSGRASIAVQWPEPGRLIPKAAHFVRVRAVTSGGDPVGTQPDAVDRPGPGEDSTTVITINGLPVGATITFIAEAFANDPDPGNPDPGPAQARGQQAILIRNDAPNTFDISMASSVAQIAVFNGPTEVIGNLNVIAGQDIPLTAQARNATGAMVLVDDSNWDWSRSGTTEITFNSQPSATGPSVTARGHATIPIATIRIQEGEASKIRDIPIQVVEPNYPGAVDGNIADGALGFGDVASGPMDTKADGDRAFALITRNPCQLLDCTHRDVDIYDSETLAIRGSFIPTFAGPFPHLIVRNSTGIAIGYDNQTSPSTIINWRDDGTIRWTSESLDMIGLLDISARRGHTYALQDAPGVGFRVTKLRDSDGRIVKRFFGPPGTTRADRITVDDEENIYLGVGGGTPWVTKMDRNGDPQPFDVQTIPFQFVLDIDFDQGLVYVMDSTNGGGIMGRVFVFGQSGKLVQTIPLPGSADDSPMRMSVFRGQVFIVTNRFQILKFFR